LILHKALGHYHNEDV